MPSATSAGRSAPGTAEGAANRIELDLPAQAELFYLARMAAAAVGARADFSCDQLDNLRLAIDEMFLMFLEGLGPRVRIHLDFEWDDDSVEVVATLHDRIPDTHAQPEVNLPTFDNSMNLSDRILDALVDEHNTTHEGGVSRSRLRLSRQDSI